MPVIKVRSIEKPDVWKEYKTWKEFRTENDVTPYMVRQKKLEWNTKQAVGNPTPVYIQGWELIMWTK